MSEEDKTGTINENDEDVQDLMPEKKKARKENQETTKSVDEVELKKQSEGKKEQISENSEKTKSNEENNKNDKKNSKKVPPPQLNLSSLPTSQMYEKSYQHNSNIQFILTTTRTHCVVTASDDGVLKIWKKMPKTSIANASSIVVQLVKEFKIHRSLLNSAHLFKKTNIFKNSALLASKQGEIGGFSSVTASKLDGSLLATAGLVDKSIKIIDVISFDLINTISNLPYFPGLLQYVHGIKDTERSLPNVELLGKKRKRNEIEVFERKFVTEVLKRRQVHVAPLLAVVGNGNELFILDVIISGGNTHETCVVHEFPKDLHQETITCVGYNESYGVGVSCDKSGVIQYWSAQKWDNFRVFPFATSKTTKNQDSEEGETVVIQDKEELFASLINGVEWRVKEETHLKILESLKTYATSITFSHDGKKFACMCRDRKVRVFDFSTGKMIDCYSDTLELCRSLQEKPLSSKNEKYKVENIDFGRRMAIEKEIERVYDGTQFPSIAEIKPFLKEKKEISDEEKETMIETFYQNRNSNIIPNCNVLFDETGNFIIFSTLFGIKVINTITKKVEVLLGKVENTERFLQIALFQERLQTTKSVVAEMEKKIRSTQSAAAAASDASGHLNLFAGGGDGSTTSSSLSNEVSVTQNALHSGTREPSAGILSEPAAASIAATLNPKLDHGFDPTIFALSFRKNRFFCFTQREPDESSTVSRDERGSGSNAASRISITKKSGDEEETESADEEDSASEEKINKNIGRFAVIHTTLGDITATLFGDLCPKTVENFTRLASESKVYSGVIFHRVIRDFMIQTGDYEKGNGTGGTSIWGKEFEDEFNPNLNYETPFKLCMANRGPNTNGSQFFITTVKCPWLNGKHTIFGEVDPKDEESKNVVKKIEFVKTERGERPIMPPKILNVDIFWKRPNMEK